MALILSAKSNKNAIFQTDFGDFANIWDCYGKAK